MEDKYLTYSSIALAGEESFVRFVRHGENALVWKDWLNVHVDMQSTAKEARQIVLAFGQVPQAMLSEEDKKQLWYDISTNLSTEANSTSKSKVKGIWTWALAAAASLALLFWFGSEAGKQNIYAEAGEHKELILPEESMVSINAGSRLTYNKKSFEKDRILHLEGEAFFNVEPGSTFKVLTNEGTVTVVGTSFNVLAREGRFEVRCYTGKVRVERNAANETMLTTGKRTTVAADEGVLTLSEFNASVGKPEWTEGRFHFDNRPLTEVFGELERQYDVDVILSDGLGEIKYTGLFESGDLAEAIKLITWPLQLESTIKGKTITITR